MNLRSLDETVYCIRVNNGEFNLLRFILPQRMTQALTPAVNRRWTSANDGQILQCSKKGTAWTLLRKSAGAECSEANTTEAETNNVKLQLDHLHWEVFFHWTLSPAALLPPQGCVCWCRREVTSPWQNQSTSNLHIHPPISFFTFLYFLGSAHPIWSDLDLCWRKPLCTGTTWGNSLELGATQSVYLKG